MIHNIIDYLKPYAKTMAKKYSPKYIVLYGSYARGDQKAYSDIDVALIYDEYKGDYGSGIVDIYRDGINYNMSIEAVLLELNNDDSGFAHSVLEQGVILYRVA